MGVTRRASKDSAKLDSYERAVQLLRMYMSMLIGVVLREAGAAPTLGQQDRAEAARRENVLTRSGLPTLSIAAPFIAAFEPDVEF